MTPVDVAANLRTREIQREFARDPAFVILPHKQLALIAASAGLLEDPGVLPEIPAEDQPYLYTKQEGLDYIAAAGRAGARFRRLSSEIEQIRADAEAGTITVAEALAAIEAINF